MPSSIDNSREATSPAEPPRNTFPKAERLCGRTAVGNLIEKGRGGEAGCLRYRRLSGTGTGLNRVMVSVPKRNFKRAVKRNLLKRRIRESYRLQKHCLQATGTDLLIIYTAAEVRPYAEIYEAVGKILSKINAHELRKAEKDRP